MTLDTREVCLPTLLATLAQYGWASQVTPGDNAESVIGELCKMGRILGGRRAARAGALEEVIEPLAQKDAHPRSLSARFGMDALPFHVELSHRRRPCRYILLGCIDPGLPSPNTMLLDWHTLGFTPDELSILEGAPILVRTGRRSFYSTLLSAGREFLRYDPGCLEAVDERGRHALGAVQRRLGAGNPKIHQWRRGDILIIDNWRALHGRSEADRGSSRRLARILIDG